MLTLLWYGCHCHGPHIVNTGDNVTPTDFGNFTTTIPRTLHPTETNHVIVCLSLALPHLNCVFNSRHGMTWAKDAQMQPIPKRVFQLRCGHVELTI
jgi:hypothetical protein